MKTLITTGLVALTLLLAACEKTTDPATAPVENAGTAPAVPPAAPAATENIPAATALDLSKVPVEEQYEKEIEQEVTPANFEVQLDALEKEIKAE